MFYETFGCFKLFLRDCTDVFCLLVYQVCFQDGKTVSCVYLLLTINSTVSNFGVLGR
jgi:hypothetical protein